MSWSNTRRGALVQSIGDVLRTVCACAGDISVRCSMTRCAVVQRIARWVGSTLSMSMSMSVLGIVHQLARGRALMAVGVYRWVRSIALAQAVMVMVAVLLMVRAAPGIVVAVMVVDKRVQAVE